MPPDIHNPFDNRPPADPSTADFLGKLMGPDDADAFRKAMGEEEKPSTTIDSTTEPTPEDLARAKQAQDKLRETNEKKLHADYLAWAQEFNLNKNDPQEWIDETFIFNSDGTVETIKNLALFNKGLSRLPKGLTRVNGFLDLGNNQLASLDGLPSEIHRDLYLNDNPLTSLEGLKGKKIGGYLSLLNIPTITIPEGIELGGLVYVKKSQTVLAEDARAKGYTVEMHD